jgi:hypothetical protein
MLVEEPAEAQGIISFLPSFFTLSYLNLIPAFLLNIEISYIFILKTA